MSTEMEYRTRIYAKYSTEKLPHVLELDEGGYRRWAEGCSYRLRGWLPRSRDARCLDVACGHGNFLFLLQEAGYHNITGIDLSPEQVTMARRVWHDVQHGNALEYLVGKTNEFDLITCFDMIEHLRKDEILSFLDLAQTAIRPGGALIIQTPNAESPWGAMHRYHDFTHETGFDPHSLAHILRLAGFDDFEARECGPYVHGMRSAVRATLWRSIHAGLALWNLAETGSQGSGVYTRNFLARVVRPAAILPENPGSAASVRRVASPAETAVT